MKIQNIKIIMLVTILTLVSCQNDLYQNQPESSVKYRVKQDFKAANGMNLSFSNLYDLPDRREMAEADVSSDDLMLPPTLSRPGTADRAEATYAAIEFSISSTELEKKLVEVFKAMTLARDKHIKYLKSDMSKHLFWFKIHGSPSLYQLQVSSLAADKSSCLYLSL